MADLPTIPLHWIWAPLGEIAEVKLGKMLSAKAFEKELRQLPYLRNQNVRWGTIDYSDIKTMGFKPSEMDRYSLAPGDLLVCEGGEPGRCAVYSGPAGAFMYQKALHRIRPHGGHVLPRYLQFCLWNYVANGLVLPRPSETTIQHLPLEKMLEVLIPVPPLAEQARIVDEIDRQFSRLDAGITSLERGLVNLKHYRAAVLKAACGGELTSSKTISLADILREDLANGRSVPSRQGGFPVLRLNAISSSGLDLSQRKEGNWTRAEALSFLIKKGDFFVARGNGSLSLVGRGSSPSISSRMKQPSPTL